MTQKQRLMRTAVVLVLILPGVGSAVAQSEQPKVSVQKDAVEPTTVQTAPVVKSGPVSRPGNWGGSLAPQGVISVFLTEAECTGLGGKVDTVATKKCDSGKACVTAGSDGVIRSACITKS